MNHKKIQRIMRKYGLTAMVRRKNPYKQMMKKSLEHRTFPNKLQREFHQILPFKVFCADITYIPFLSRFAYLSVIKDIASGRSCGMESLSIPGSHFGYGDREKYTIGFVRKHHDSL